MMKCDGCGREMQDAVLIVMVNGNLLMFCKESCFDTEHYTRREKERILKDPENVGCKTQLLRLFEGEVCDD